jgi:Kef-type K+ transport system membrane component KefB
MKKIITILVMLGSLIFPLSAYASEESVDHLSQFPLVFLFIVTLLLLARIGSLIERCYQPSVLGELLMGVLLATVALCPCFHGIVDIARHPLVVGVAEIGVLLLLFRTGLESNLHEMKHIGLKSFTVAIVGVILPFIGGYIASKMLLPDLENNTCLFVGATLTATSVGISSRVFKDLNILKTIEAQIVLGAAVIDDVLGLLILAIVGGIVSSGHVEVVPVIILCVKAIGFLLGTIVLGRLFAPYLGALAARIHSGVGMKMALALVFCGGFAYLASALAGLAPIIGAFAAGLILDPVHFKKFKSPHLVKKLHSWSDQLRQSGGSIDLIREMEKEAICKDRMHVEHLIEGISSFFVPIFFVYTGFQVDLSVFSDTKTIGIAFIITAVAVLGKLACGYVAGKSVDRKLIGFGMIPRGEVGLIFLNVGKRLGVVNSQIFAIGVIMVILTTLLTPPILNAVIRKRNLINLPV